MSRALLLLALAVTGCGASAVEVHARAAHAAGGVLTLAHDAIRDARRAEVDRAIAAAPTREDAEDARDAIDLRYEPITDAYMTVQSVHSAWVRLIVAAAAGSDFNLPLALSLGAELVTAYAELSRLATHVGLNLPDLGDTVNAALAASEE